MLYFSEHLYMNPARAALFLILLASLHSYITCTRLYLTTDISDVSPKHNLRNRIKQGSWSNEIHLLAVDYLVEVFDMKRLKLLCSQATYWSKFPSLVFQSSQCLHLGVAASVKAQPPAAAAASQLSLPRHTNIYV